MNVPVVRADLGQTSVRQQTRVSDRRGAALVEFAIVLVLLLTIVLGCVDFGRYASSYIVLTSAAREGALAGAMNPPGTMGTARWDRVVRDAVLGEMSSVAGFDPNRLTLVAEHATGQQEDRTQVRVQVQYPFQTLVPWVGIPEQMHLSRTVQMRVIR
jgi:Flp pilus assembly protein TadG